MKYENTLPINSDLTDWLQTISSLKREQIQQYDYKTLQDTHIIRYILFIRDLAVVIYAQKIGEDALYSLELHKKDNWPYSNDYIIRTVLHMNLKLAMKKLFREYLDKNASQYLSYEGIGRALNRVQGWDK